MLFIKENLKLKVKNLWNKGSSIFCVKGKVCFLLCFCMLILKWRVSYSLVVLKYLYRMLIVMVLKEGKNVVRRFVLNILLRMLW